LHTTTTSSPDFTARQSLITALTARSKSPIAGSLDVA
jgi:hypothetical protein